jgi:hypothetical protein
MCFLVLNYKRSMSSAPIRELLSTVVHIPAHTRARREGPPCEGQMAEMSGQQKEDGDGNKSAAIRPFRHRSGILKRAGLGTARVQQYTRAPAVHARIHLICEPITILRVSILAVKTASLLKRGSASASLLSCGRRVLPAEMTTLNNLVQRANLEDIPKLIHCARYWLGVIAGSCRWLL